MQSTTQASAFEQLQLKYLQRFAERNQPIKNDFVPIPHMPFCLFDNIHFFLRIINQRCQ